MGVKLSVIAKAIEGTVYTCKEYLDNEVEYGFSSDLMSDVLTIDKEDVIDCIIENRDEIKKILK